jgi:hypothetical protein
MTLRLQLWAVVAALGLAQAWHRGSEGRAQWDYECHFEGLELQALASEPSSGCADLCLADTSCSHWTWIPEGDGTCELKQGAANVVQPHASHLCGFLPTRFALDEADAFDLGLKLPEEPEEGNDRMTGTEAETALRLLNSFRSRRGKSKLSLDARLVLVADSLAATCREVPFTTSMKDGQGYEFFAALPGSVPTRGFTGQVHAVSVAAPQDSLVNHAIEWWTSGVDPKTGTKPFYLDDMAVVGFAKRKGSSCWKSTADGSEGGSGIVWTMLLAGSE